MVTQEAKDRKAQEIQQYLNKYAYYKEQLKEIPVEFPNKAAQKELLEKISRCFEELANADQVALIIPMWELEEQGKDSFDISYVYYNFPTSPYQFTEKKQDMVKDFCPHLSELIELRELWLKVKEAKITKKSVEETRIERKENKLKTIDYSKITDLRAWNNAVVNMVAEIDKLITPKYNKIVSNLIELKKLYNAFLSDKSLREELDTKFPNWQNEICHITKSEQDIIKIVKLWQRDELLDLQYKLYTTLNFDITSVKVIEYSSCYREWTINDTQRLIIETIVAGGYNIQCLHNRTLIKLNKI